MNMARPSVLQRITRASLISQIAASLVLGILLAVFAPSAAASVALLGDVFVSALKAVAPVLVFVLVASAIASHRHGQPTHIRPVLILYLIGTLGAALVAVVASFAFPTTLILDAPQAAGTPPGGIVGVLKNLLLSAVANPVKALMEANYIGILAWAAALGIGLRHATESTRTLLVNVADAVSGIVRMVIRLAPLGIFGLVASTLADTGLGALLDYGRLLLLIVGCMLFVALVMNPLIVFWKIRRNPYPLVFTCLRERDDCVLHPQLGRQHPDQPRPMPSPRPARGHLLDLDSARRHHQHGGRGHHHHGDGPRCRAHAGHPG